MTKPIHVTKPNLPPLDQFMPMLEQIWQNQVLTNNGPFHAEFEEALKAYLGVNHISVFANGTLALLTALQALRINGEVITTPYSFVATSHTLLWNGIKPVFVDVNPDTLNIDPKGIESAITRYTTAILPVHCYGNPCDVDAIEQLADAYNLKVVYDAAHAFAVRDARGSVLNYGDLSVLSFHATKIFNTFEGGAIICPDAKTKKRIDQLKNFGFVDETTVVAPGINGKMSEFNAALGILQLKFVAHAIDVRGQIDAMYRERLSGVTGIRCLAEPPGLQRNYAYFPLLVDHRFPMSRDELYAHLRAHGINGRRYFYPLISSFPMYRDLPSAEPHKLPNATRAAEQVICLPIYPDLGFETVQRIADLICEAGAGKLSADIPDLIAAE